MTQLLKLLDESRVVYWVMATGLGLILYRLIGIRTLLRHWPVTVLFTGATAVLAFRSPAATASEWQEVAWYAAIWTVGAAGYDLAARIGRRPEQPRQPVTVVQQRPPARVAVPAQPPATGKRLPTTEQVAAFEEIPAPVPSVEPLVEPAPPGDVVARALAHLWAGRISEGRALLEERCQSLPADAAALAWSAWDWQRPPPDLARSLTSLQRLRNVNPRSCEAASIELVNAFSHRNYEGLGIAYSELMGVPPTTRLGHHLALLAWLCASDFRYQTQYLPGSPAKMFVSSVIRGTAQLLQRQHAAADETFRTGYAGADTFPDRLSEWFQRGVNTDHRITIAAQVRLECLLGQALVQADMGRHDVALMTLDKVILPVDERQVPHYAGFLSECRGVAKSISSTLSNAASDTRTRSARQEVRS